MPKLLAKQAWAAEYTNCISAEKLDSPNECPKYDTKLSDGEAPAMLELWGMQSTPSLPSFPSPLRPGEVEPNRVLSMGQIELNSALIVNWIVWNRAAYMYKNGFDIK